MLWCVPAAEATGTKSGGNAKAAGARLGLSGKSKRRPRPWQRATRVETKRPPSRRSGLTRLLCMELVREIEEVNGETEFIVNILQQIEVG